MRIKTTAVAVTAAMVISMAVPVGATSIKVYNFSDMQTAANGLEEVTEARLTDDITVTTSGNMNYKYAAVTDLEKNKTLGTYPINSEFTYSGSYIYLGAASTNNGAVFTLNMPKIEAGSRVIITYAKPVVTNNGSTKRNTNDPYAYFKIGDRYLSINGGDFDEWKTETITTGVDASSIDFYCDKWGAVAISKIEIADSKGSLHSITVNTNEYSNVKVNNVSFYTDESGILTLPSYASGENVDIEVSKDGYTSRAKKTGVSDSDLSFDMPLDCEKNSVYYESDFGNADGNLILDGSFSIGSIEKKPVISVSANITFSDNGYCNINSESGELAGIKYSAKNGITSGDKNITQKNNMEFKMFLDSSGGYVTLIQNGEQTTVSDSISGFDYIKSISGKNVTIEYIDVAYPDISKISIDGPDFVSSPYKGSNVENTAKYTISGEYVRPGNEIKTTVSGVSGVKMSDNMLVIPENAEGTVTIKAEYEDSSVTKSVKIVRNAKLNNIKHDGNTINLYSQNGFEIYGAEDEYGNPIDGKMINLRDFKSSDESVLKVDENGTISAVGKGEATITANAYTGSDNTVSCKYTVDRFYIDGSTDNQTTYIKNDISENDNITGYKVYYSDGTSENIEMTDIPATTMDADGTIINVYYDMFGKLRSVHKEEVKAGDTVPVSNGLKTVYLYSQKAYTKLETANTMMKGFELKHATDVEYEISPLITFENVGDVSEDTLLKGTFASGIYDLTFKKGEAKRGDIFVNGYMVGNNVDQADADRKVSEGSTYKAEDIKIKNGEISVMMTDGSTKLTSVKIEKKPDFYNRPQRVYVIGDSLACIYYGDFEKQVGGGRAGWGQQLPSYLNVPVTDLANSGQYASGLYKTAFPSIIENGEKGDVALIECAYNDRNYSNRDEMTESVKNMVSECELKGIVPILVTPNASAHDYKPSVAWSSYLKDIAADTNTPLIDLSKQSYDFLYSLYGDDEDKVVTKNFNLTEVGGDTLHSSYAGAYVWASVVAQGMKNLGYEDIVNDKFAYTFTDTEGNKITAKVN